MLTARCWPSLQVRCDEKGFLAVCAFGLPGKTHEDMPARGIQSALSIVEALRAAGGVSPIEYCRTAQVQADADNVLQVTSFIDRNAVTVQQHVHWQAAYNMPGPQPASSAKVHCML